MPPIDPQKHITLTCQDERILKLARVNKYLRDRHGRLASQAARDVVSAALNAIRREIGARGSGSWSA
jgi:hypothetical protein